LNPAIAPKAHMLHSPLNLATENSRNKRESVRIPVPDPRRSPSTPIHVDRTLIDVVDHQFFFSSTVYAPRLTGVTLETVLGIFGRATISKISFSRVLIYDLARLRDGLVFRVALSCDAMEMNLARRSSVPAIAYVSYYLGPNVDHLSIRTQINNFF
jgi:hypothetical protein